MRVSLIFLLILLIIGSAVDWYLYRQLRRRALSSPKLPKLQLYTAIFLQIMLVVAILLPARSGDYTALLLKMWLLFGYATIYLPKILFVVFDLVGNIPELFRKKRLTWICGTGGVLAILLFGGMWWGALFNRFRINNQEVNISIKDLPESFEGYRIVQISDLHLGTFINDPSFLQKLIEDIKALHPDAVVFTGDIVNRQSDEIYPFIETLSSLNAPDGVYAILGNHDYGDYMDWDSPEQKQLNMARLYEAYDRTNIRLLLNETAWLHRGNDSIALIGVENIGDPPFPIYGSLAKAYPTPEDNNSKILLSHNPAHWVDSIADNPKVNIPLTLSGHTHAMQIELFGFSPAAWRYETWGGLYSDSTCTHQLYVNIGAGTVGMPMRLGATPEVTVITLYKSTN